MTTHILIFLSGMFLGSMIGVTTVAICRMAGDDKPVQKPIEADCAQYMMGQGGK